MACNSSFFCYLSNNSSGALKYVKGRIGAFLGNSGWLEVELFKWLWEIQVSVSVVFWAVKGDPKLGQKFWDWRISVGPRGSRELSCQLKHLHSLVCHSLCWNNENKVFWPKVYQFYAQMMWILMVMVGVCAVVVSGSLTLASVGDCSWCRVWLVEAVSQLCS